MPCNSSTSVNVIGKFINVQDMKVDAGLLSITTVYSHTKNTRLALLILRIMSIHPHLSNHTSPSLSFLRLPPSPPVNNGRF